MMTTAPSERTTVVRRAERAAYDAASVHAVLDAALVCHVGFVLDGSPAVLPTIHGRIGDDVYIHGSVASRMLRTIAPEGEPCCVTATIVDGIVLARSAFHHSMNYRSVVVFGAAVAVRDDDEKRDALRAISGHIAPGRWDDPGVRLPTPRELAQTFVLRVGLSEASAKIRTGPPSDLEEDQARDVWAGVLPLTITPGTPVADELTPAGVPVPAYLSAWASTER